MTELDEILQEFLVESYENLDQLDRDLVALEQDPTSRDLLSSIFRTIHTIKGTSGFLALPRLEALTHVGENLLSKLRGGALLLSPDIVDGLLDLVDEVRAMLGSIEHGGGEGTPDHQVLIAKLGRLQQPAEHLDVEARLIGESRLLAQHEAADQRSSVVDSTIRVDVAILDTLMRLVGELVLTRNQIMSASGKNRPESQGLSQRLSALVLELQEGVMKTRMQPIEVIWNKLPRVVRDLAATCGRQARLETEGRNTELDRTILEAVRDPLMHLIRNSMDHGIEPPEDRVAAGKPVEGVIRLKAHHQGGQVNIEITDDGGASTRSGSRPRRSSGASSPPPRPAR